MKCQNCGFEIAQDELFCGNCGQKVQMREDNAQEQEGDNARLCHCGECGAEVTMGTAFCPECGKPLINIGVPEDPNQHKKKSHGLVIAIAIVCILAVIIIITLILVNIMTYSDSREEKDSFDDKQSAVDSKAQDDNVVDSLFDDQSQSDEYFDEDDNSAVERDIDGSSDDTTSIAVEPDEENDIGNSETISHPYTFPVFTSAEASSMLGMSATGNEYYPSYVLDNNAATCWASDSREGLNPSITLRAEYKQTVSGIRFSNGYFKSEKVYYNNRRITKIQISYEGGTTEYSCEPEQYLVMQDVLFDSPVETNFITIKVMESEPGVEGSNDICISTIDVY